jgi:hypothetical protein
VGAAAIDARAPAQSSRTQKSRVTGAEKTAHGDHASSAGLAGTTDSQQGAMSRNVVCTAARATGDAAHPGDIHEASDPIGSWRSSSRWGRSSTRTRKPRGSPVIRRTSIRMRLRHESGHRACHRSDAPGAGGLRGDIPYASNLLEITHETIGLLRAHGFFGARRPREERDRGVSVPDQTARQVVRHELGSRRCDRTLFPSKGSPR